jgi:hypothetical protein
VHANTLGPPLSTVRTLELDGNLSLYDSASGQAAVLNGTASDVWRLLDGEHDFDAVVAILADAYDLPTDQIRDDVERAVATLTEFLIPQQS